jgi:hypothetical protein
VRALTDLFVRIKGRYQRTASRRLARRHVTMQNDRPLISFTFDDFPRSALFTGGALLERYGVATQAYSYSTTLMLRETMALKRDEAPLTDLQSRPTMKSDDGFC